MAVPDCKKCGRGMQQPGRYAEWVCECCDMSARCPHVSLWTRMMRRFAGRRV